MVYTIIVHLYAKADEESISKLKAKLVEASQVYSKDKETLSWFVMQDTVDPRKFSIVERYQQESVRATRRAARYQPGRARANVMIVQLTNIAVPAIPPEQSLLEDFRPIRLASARCAYGPAKTRGDGYQCSHGWCTLPSGRGEGRYFRGEHVQ
jgi:quinol monooxygenase YgiN